MNADLIGGRYQCLERIGEGGMAKVYRARDMRLEREVAIKVVLQAPDDDNRLFYFHREARAIAALHHPNIVPIHDYSGPEESPVYIVMPMVPHGDLEAALDGRDLPPEEFILSVALSIAAALGHAHDRGVVHRDLKLSNILIDEGGRLLLTDFGLAKGYKDQAILGETVVRDQTQLFGTPNYMSPEMVRGHKPGPASDMFSLGVILYYLTVGELPFDGKMPATVMKNIVDGVYRRLEVSPESDRSARLVATVERCLANAPELRPSAAEVVNECDYRLAEVGAHKAEVNIGSFLGLPGVEVAGSRAKWKHRAAPSAPKSPKRAMKSVDPAPAQALSPLDDETTVADSQEVEFDGSETIKSPVPSFVLEAGEAPSRDFSRRQSKKYDALFAPPSKRAAGSGKGIVVEAPNKAKQPQPLPGEDSVDATLINGRLDRVHRRRGAKRWRSVLLLSNVLILLALVLVPVAVGPQAIREYAQRYGVWPGESPGASDSQLASDTAPVSPPGAAAKKAAPQAGDWEDAIDGVIRRAEAAHQANRERDNEAETGAEAQIPPPADGKKRKRARQGILHVMARPWATIAVDGQRLGTTPTVSRLKIPPGEHTVIATHPNNEPQQKKVTITAGETTKVMFLFRSEKAD